MSSIVPLSRRAIHRAARRIVPKPLQAAFDRALVEAFEIAEYEIEPRIYAMRSFVRRMRGDSIRYFDAATARDDGESLTFSRSRIQAPPREGDFVLERDRRDPAVIQVSTIRHIDRKGIPFGVNRRYRVVCGYIGDAHELRDRSYLLPNPREHARVRSPLSREAGLGVKHAVPSL